MTPNPPAGLPQPSAKGAVLRKFLIFGNMTKNRRTLPETDMPCCGSRTDAPPMPGLSAGTRQNNFPGFAAEALPVSPLILPEFGKISKVLCMINKNERKYIKGIGSENAQ